MQSSGELSSWKPWKRLKAKLKFCDLPLIYLNPSIKVRKQRYFFRIDSHLSKFGFRSARFPKNDRPFKRRFVATSDNSTTFLRTTIEAMVYILFVFLQTNLYKSVCGINLISAHTKVIIYLQWNPF